MYKPQEDVNEFMRACDQDVLDVPTIPSDRDMHLRCKLILEEAFEFVEAAGYSVRQTVGSNEESSVGIDRKYLQLRKMVSPNMLEMAKELADINVVTYGAASAIGVKLSEVFEEVHESNMTKVQPDGKVIKNSYGKVQKGQSYIEPNVFSILRMQGWIEK
jgi:predicted HAD superfamily Cof-like phosphohydrolase